MQYTNLISFQFSIFSILFLTSSVRGKQFSFYNVFFNLSRMFLKLFTLKNVGQPSRNFWDQNLIKRSRSWSIDFYFQGTLLFFKGLSRPLNMNIDEDDVEDHSMVITWRPVPHAPSYLLLVYDCSGRGRTATNSKLQIFGFCLICLSLCIIYDVGEVCLFVQSTSRILF